MLENVITRDTNPSQTEVNEIHVDNKLDYVDQCLSTYKDDDATSIASSITYRHSNSDSDSILYCSSDSSVHDEQHCDDNLFDYLKNAESAQNEKFPNENQYWAKQFKIPHNAINSLLSILNKNTNTQFPKDSRTLLKTPKSTNVINMDNGQYCHIGLTNAIKKIIENRLILKHKFSTVNLLINVDGAPISGNSSEKGVWTILCKDSELKSVYVVGIYHGIKKPQDPNVFLKNFVDKTVVLINNKFTHNNKIYNVRIHAFICDAPAKSFILNTKYPNGYNSCSKCLIEGEYYNSVCFPLANRKSLEIYCNTHLRSDEKFKNLEYNRDYQHGSTILNLLPYVGLVSNVPLDPMHLVFIGVMRQIIKHWLGNKRRKKKVINYQKRKLKKFQTIWKN
ncbi:uncharacterized protein LOC143907321 [Temnothorax americanus]|uniref:uncharacterized protein LOC143907321 n=1 Tax=Temnothorax americanus TaxID=1964332 RepID=UPI004067B4FD